MKILMWVLQGVLAAVFVGSGAMKVITPADELAASANMGWAEDFSPWMITAIGGVEILGAIGLILPVLFGVAELLTPLAAAGLAMIMAGAVVTHAVRGEWASTAPALLFGVLAGVVAWGRFRMLRPETEKEVASAAA